ncbi:MAG: hexose kinase [Armatimonadota bacterium]
MCANAGIDRTYEVKNFSVGKFHNPERFTVVPGGKGVNVARDLSLLGDEVMLMGFAGDMARPLMSEKLGQENVVTDLVPIGEESRVCINIVDPNAGTQTQVDETSPLVTPTEVETLKRAWRRQMKNAELAVISGSAPRGVPHHFYHDLVVTARKAGVPVIVDARDQLLEYVIDAKPHVITPNRAELQDLMQETLTVPDGIAQAGRNLVSEGIKIVVCTLGRRGAIFVTTAGSWWALAPDVQALSPVGSGDALVAGFAHASIRRQPVPERIRWAIAAGSAAATAFGATLENRELVEELIADIEINRIDAE